MKNWSIHLLVALALAACKKENIDADGLVPATQEGKNTGDFLLNNSPFSPRPRVSSPGDSPVGAVWNNYSREHIMQIALFREDDGGRFRALNVILSNLRLPGTYRLMNAIIPNVVAGSKSYIVYTSPGTYPTPYKYCVTGPASPGQVIITRFDTVAHVVSGTFEAKLREYNGPDSVSITKGRFDCSF